MDESFLGAFRHAAAGRRELELVGRATDVTYAPNVMYERRHVWATSSKLMQLGVERTKSIPQNDATYALHAAMEQKIGQDFNDFIIGDKQPSSAVLSVGRG